MPFAHPDSPLARKLSHSGSAASRASHMSTTPSSGRSDCVTSEVTTGERKTIVQTATHIRPKSASAPAGESNETAHSAARTRPKSNSVFPKTSEQNLQKATPSQIRLTREHNPPMGGVSPAPRVRRGTNGHWQDEVVVKRSTHATTGPREERHATLVKGQTISIEGQRADSHPQAANLAQLKQPPMKQALPRGRHTTSEDPDVAPPTMSGRTEHYKAEMESLCRPPNQRMVSALFALLNRIRFWLSKSTTLNTTEANYSDLNATFATFKRTALSCSVDIETASMKSTSQGSM
jgi:hypothetical protein